MGQTYQCPPEIPLDFADYLRNAQMRAAIESLLGEEQAAQFLAAKPSMDDFSVFSEQVAKEYGLGDAGKLPASLRL